MFKASILALLFAFVLTSCEKDTDDPTPPTPPKTNTEMLTSSTWRVKELIRQVNSSQSRYVRGGSNTTGSNFSNSRLTFNEDGTGSFTDPLNATYSLTWEFEVGDETKIDLLINYPVPQELNYDFVAITENNFIHTIYYQDGADIVLATAQYEAVP